MNRDPHSKNEEIDPVENDNRRFTVVLVFIVIIGLSLIAGILKFRQAKREVKEFSLQNQERQKVPGLSPKENSSSNQVDQSSRLPQHKEEELPKGTQKKLIPSKRDRPPRPRKIRKMNGLFSSLKYSNQYYDLEGADYLLVENMAAVSLDQKDRYSSEEIVGERHNKLFILIQDGESAPSDALGVAYNTRSKRLALVTGTLKIRFEDQSSFEERLQHFHQGIREKRTFDAIKLSLVEFQNPMDLEGLYREQTKWQQISGVKEVSLELLESEIVVK